MTSLSPIAANLGGNVGTLVALVLGSVSFGSLLTLALTWLKEWHADRSKRRADLQREIFFEAATSVRDTSRSVQRLSNAQIPLASPDETISGPSGGWLEKLYLIAGEGTLRELTLRDKAAGVAHFRLCPLRFAITELDQQIATNRARLEQIAQARAELANLATEAQKKELVDPELYRFAYQTFQELLAEEQSVNDILSKLWQRRNDIHHRLISEGFDSVVTLRSIERRSLLEMRKEMRVGGALAAQANRAMDAADEEVRKLVAEFFSSFASQVDALVDVTNDSSDQSLLPPGDARKDE